MKILNRSQRRAKRKRDKENPLRKAKLVKKRPVLAVKIYPDGREVCNLKTFEGRLIYFCRTNTMRLRQVGLCGICHRPMTHETQTFDHEDGRGSGGSRRDDRTEKNGKPYNRAVHGWCNVKKGSVRGYGN